MSPKSTLNLGIVGLSTKGWASAAHFPALTRSSIQSKFTISAVHNSSEASAKAAALTYDEKLSNTKDPLDAHRAPLKAFHGEASAMANDPDVDVVAITVKAPDHASFVYAAISAGKSVMVEYPPGVNLQETEEMKRRLDESRGKIKAMVGLQGRQSSTIQKVKKAIESGKIGGIVSTTIICSVPCEMQAWQLEAREGGEYLLDDKNGASMFSICGGHNLDTVIYLLGEFKSVSAAASTQYPTTAIIPSSPNGRPKVVRMQVSSGAQVTLPPWIIDGEHGSIKLELSQGGAFPGPFTSLKDASVSVDGVDLEEYISAEELEFKDDLALRDGEKGTLTEFIQREWVEFAKALNGGEGEFATG
ncbi:NAD(P)-binding protein [Coprinopsis marcescibilis]|uniref:NAD(P)-binding protein n=1 Tax=Coprinopsis marcescibilis TaxID=230819 RepID=A0A5C3KIS8_COPMA|nr:NAD(P)-binding protein [Coprinopsis marcescibilis]